MEIENKEEGSIRCEAPLVVNLDCGVFQPILQSLVSIPRLEAFDLLSLNRAHRINPDLCFVKRI